jgi:hypothetical protein
MVSLLGTVIIKRGMLTASLNSQRSEQSVASGLSSRVHVTVRLTVHKVSTSHPYKQTFVICNNLAIQYKEYLWCGVVY